METAEKLLTDSRVLIKNLTAPHAIPARTVGRLDVRVLAHLVKTGKELEGKEWKNLDEITKARRPPVQPTPGLYTFYIIYIYIYG